MTDPDSKRTSEHGDTAEDLDPRCERGRVLLSIDDLTVWLPSSEARRLAAILNALADEAAADADKRANAGLAGDPRSRDYSSLAGAPVDYSGLAGNKAKP